MTWGRKPSCECGECFKCKRAAYMREWYGSKTLEERREMRKQRNAERVRAADRERYHRMKRDPAFAKRRAAIAALNNALRSGKLARGCCEVCGSQRAHAHHDDYALPLDVRWLCPRHHADEHRQAA